MYPPIRRAEEITTTVIQEVRESPANSDVAQGTFDKIQDTIKELKEPPHNRPDDDPLFVFE